MCVCVRERERENLLEYQIMLSQRSAHNFGLDFPILIILYFSGSLE